MSIVAPELTATSRSRLSRLRESPFLREFLFYGTSSISYQGSRFVVFMVAARILGPHEFGLWNVVNLVLIYGAFAHLGSINGMNRDVPLFKGKEDPEKVRRIRSATAGFMSFSTLVAASLLIWVAPHIVAPAVVTLLRLMAALFIVFQLYSFCQIYLVSDSRFYQMSYQQLAFASLLPMVAIPFALKWKLNGFILGQAIVYLAAALLMIRIVGFDIRLSLDWSEVRRLISVGWPIAAVGLCFGLFTTVDRWVVLGYLGTTQLGYYSLTIIVGGALTLLPKVLSQQIYPRMAETFGRTSDHKSLKKWIFRQVVGTSSLVTPAILFVFFALPPVVRTFLPAYQPGINAVRIALLGFLFLPLAYAFGNFLTTVDRQLYYLAVLLSAIPLEAALSIGLVKAGMGINGVAIGMSVSTLLYSVALCLVGIRVLNCSKLATDVAN